jgi:hypothetical protein
MTKFGKSGKIGPSDFPFRTVRFWQFQGKTKEEAKLEDSKIQCVFKQEKGLKVSRDQDRRKSSKKPKL